MKVLLATDGSPNALEAARFLNQLQFDQPLDVTLLTVSYHGQSTEAEIIQPWFPDWLEKQQDFFEAHHADLERMLEGRCNSITKMQRDGHAASMILNEAKAGNVDLIVIGAQGHSMIGRVVLGSVSDSVATHAPCSVLVVRPDRNAPAEEPNRQHPLRAIAVAYDGSSAALQALNEIRTIRWDKETDITLVTISPVYDYMMGEGLAAVALENEQAVNESMRETLDEVCQQLVSVFPNIKGRVDKGRHIGDAIVDVTEQEKTDLVIIGDAGHTLLHDWILGSTTKYVLRHAPCSVWISRHHRRTPTDTGEDKQ